MMKIYFAYMHNLLHTHSLGHIMVLLCLKKIVSTPSGLFLGCLHADMLWAHLFLVEVQPLLIS